MSKHYARLMVVAILISLMVGMAPSAAQAPELQVQLKAAFGVTVDRTPQGAPQRGIVIREVSSDSLASQAGLQKGDLITMVGRRVVEDYEDLANAMRRHQTGAALMIQVRRGGVERTCRIVQPQATGDRLASGGGEGPGNSPAALGTGEQLQRLFALVGEKDNQTPSRPTQAGTRLDNRVVQERIFQRLQSRLLQMKAQGLARTGQDQIGGLKGSSAGQDVFAQRLQTGLQQLQRLARGPNRATQYGAMKGAVGVQGDFAQQLQSRLEQLKKDAPTRDGQPQYGALQGNATVQDRIYQRLQTRLQQIKGETLSRAGARQFGAAPKDSTIQDRIYQRLQTRLQQIKGETLKGSRPNQVGAIRKAGSQDMFAQRLQGRLQQIQKQARRHHLQNQYGALKGSGADRGEFSQRLFGRLEELQKQARNQGGQQRYGAFKADRTIQDRIFQRLQKRLQQLAAESGSPMRPDQATRKPMEMNRQAGGPFIGVQVGEWMADEAQRKGGVAEEGVIVTAVDPNSPAAAAGIQKGDVINRVNNKAIINRQDLRQVVQQAGPGQDVTLKVLRGNQPKVIQAHLEADAGATDQARLIQQLQNRIQRLEDQLQQLKRD
jgi:C-terminal processing protease CtpA/Prc